MASILQSVPQPPSEKPPFPETAPPQSGSMLKEIAADAEKKVPPQFLDGFNRIMAAGRKAMWSDKGFGMKGGTKDYLSAITSPQEVPNAIAHGVMKLLTLIFNQSKGSMPIESVGLAGLIFMCDALEYLEEVKKMPIDKAVIDQTTMAVKDGTLLWIKQASGISEEKWQEVMSQGGKPTMTLMQGGKQPAMNAPPAPTAPPVEGEV